MTWYRVFLATGHEDIEADLVREINYEKDTAENHQPSICFYKGQNPNRDHIVAQFIIKNIGGYRVIRPNEIPLLNR